MRPAHGPTLLLFLGALAGGCLLGPSPSTRTDILTGQVTDEQGRPLAGARARFQGQCQATVTDSSGRFRLPAPSREPRRVTAWKEGFGIAAAFPDLASVRLRLRPLPAEDNDEYAWIDPTPDPARPLNCGNCHGAIHREWAASGHARAATGRHFRNLFDGTDWHGRPVGGWSLLAQRPEGAGVCAACHAPTFRDPTLEYDFRTVSGVAARGVHCDYCHKVVEAPTDRLGTRFGRDGLRLLRPADGQQLFFGPLDDAHREGETFGYAPLYKESRYCASCHEGVVFGIHVYGTYSEWLGSPARRQGLQCQHCHMTPTGALTNIATGKGGIERDPRTLASHHFPGGQAELLRRCLSVVATARHSAGGLRVEVEVRARNVGHRVPTGFIDRNLVLAVAAFDAEGKPAPLLRGPALPPAAGKALAGAAGRLYAKLLKGPKGEGPIPFWTAHDDPEDTRLLPERADRSEYLFGAAARVRVRLLYRRFWPEVAEARRWPDNEVVVSDHILMPEGRQ
jgi:hypothetical protein